MLKSALDDTVSNRRLWLLVAVPVAMIYLASAHWFYNSTDSVAAAWPAWSLAHHGTPRLDRIHDLPINSWIRAVNGHIVSNRTLGVVLAGVPTAALLSWTGLSVVSLSTVAAALFSAAAVANTTLLLRALTCARAAVTGAAVLAFGTAMWTVAGAELWTHGPDAFWLTLGLLLLQRRRHWLAGLAVAPAAMTRPHLAVAVAALGVILAITRRQWKLLPALGIPALLALVCVVTYNWFLFGHPTLAGGAYAYAASNVVGAGGASGSDQLHAFLVALAGNFVSPIHGLLVYSPIVLILLAGGRSGWRRLPDWGRAAAVAGVAYLAVQCRVNGFQGGFDYYGNRLMLEPLVLATPLLFMTGVDLWQRGHRAIVAIPAYLSCAIAFIGATLAHIITIPWNAPSWTTWTVADVVEKAGIKFIPVAALIVLLPVLVLMQQRDRATRRSRPADLKALGLEERDQRRAAAARA